MENPASPKKLANRYEVREVLGQGGMGLVYRAYDTVVRREVAVKTILDIPDPASLQLFYKECDVLAQISHPNIIEIFDIGEFEEDGKKKPYFVMPLLPGQTLDGFVRKASHRLTVERTVEIMSQTCRGLQAAHERGLIHRDLKPSNIFVMEDDSVKIIDFGVAHMADSHTTRAQKGTLLYMSPEQIQLKPLTPASDIFSLSVVCYEALTGRHPFQRSRADEVVEAILRQIPPPASEVNASVSQSISRVVHKGMAKQAWHRYASARDLGDTLGKALRNEPIDFFDPERTRPRLQRATKALEDGDHQFAGEILGELEAEGHMDTGIGTLRRQLDAAVRRKTLAQLLDAARARFEEEEDPLALQKLSEALAIEPDNAAALSLKSRIENRRSEKQIENWYKLARQHTDNHTYAHAREALQNVLQLRPQEVRALQLIAEVDRQEQEYNKLRNEKENIHRAALDAWHKGEVSSALAKLGMVLELDRRAPDSVNRESGANYQSFYNEVRSEHDAMNTAYADARKQLGEKNFVKALSTCQTYLAKYPTNAIFQALKFDIEEQQRQSLSALIASVDREVEGEPDLEKRVSILQEALEAHPGESHFERALRLVKDKRDLVNSIVARAHLHEEQGAFGDALNDWEILRTIYSQYPGLKFEVERLQKRREQQVRIEAKTKLIEQIDTYLHSSDYGRALELLKSTAAEFPDDSELTQLEKLANSGVERTAEAHRLMNEGQDLCAQGKSPEGIKRLREAYDLDENNSLARAVLSNALIEHARAIVDSKWQDAEKFAKEGLELNPSHPMAKTIRTQILDRKREVAVAECVSQARTLQASGDLAAALARVEEGLSNYPRDPRLIQVQDTVQRDLQIQRRQTRRRDLEELRRIESEAGSKFASDEMRQTWGERVRALAGKYLEDDEVLSTANGVLGRLKMPTVSGTNKAPVPAQTDSATMSFASSSAEPAPSPSQPPPAPVVEALKSALVTTPQKPGPGEPAAKPKPQNTSAKKPAVSRQKLLVGAAAAVLLLIIILIAVIWRKKPESQTEVTSTSVAPPATPATPASTLPLVKLSSDTADGKVSFDGQPGSNLIDAQWTTDKISPGDHTLKFEAPQGVGAFVFTLNNGEIPVLKQPITASGLFALVVSSMGDHVHVYGSDAAAKVSVDGQSEQEISHDGIDLTSITPGAHELTVSQGSDQYKFQIEVGTAPALTAFIESGQNVGTLLVVTGQDRAKIYLNGKEYAQPTRGGQLRIPNLEPRDYSVRVAKNGFQELPEQKIRVRKGEQAKLVFNLQPVPHLATLAIQGSAPGTNVLIDQSQVGTIQPDGTLNVATIAPGEHMIELRRDRFKPKQLRKTFTAGATVNLASSDASMEVGPAELKINFTPADAQLTLNRAGEVVAKITSGNPVSVSGGSYALTVRTSDAVTRTATLDITGGQSRNLDLSLAPEGMSRWEDASGWKQDKGALVRKGGDFVLYGAPSAGTFVFSAQQQKGKRLQWVANYTDPNNYILCQMDDNFFYRIVTRNGQKTDEARIPQKSDKKSFRSIQIRVQAGEITHLIRQGDGWLVLDRWSQSGTNLSSGKFGFYLPGGDQIALASFGHYSDLNVH